MISLLRPKLLRKVIPDLLATESDFFRLATVQKKAGSFTFCLISRPRASCLTKRFATFIGSKQLLSIKRDFS